MSLTRILENMLPEIEAQTDKVEMIFFFKLCHVFFVRKD